jgi:hypothetical protein
VLPDCLNIAKIVPMPKVSNSKSPNELRPISIQSNIAKLFEKCLYFQLFSYINRSNLLSTSQFGFSPRHSPAHNIIKLTDYMFDALDKNETCILVTLDIRKAFYKVDREIVLSKLISFGIDPTFSVLIYQIDHILLLLTIITIYPSQAN